MAGTPFFSPLYNPTSSTASSYFTVVSNFCPCRLSSVRRDPVACSGPTLCSDFDTVGHAKKPTTSSTDLHTMGTPRCYATTTWKLGYAPIFLSFPRSLESPSQSSTDNCP